jgi:hypothetical protein|tara:strand:- start:275 stop:655 length:381 start_codon:yes stop_codon:yes gene_type:complete
MKQQYTKVFLKHLDKSTDDIAVEQHLKLWWKNTRDKQVGGLRLTDEGFDMLHQLNITMYDVPFPKEMKLTSQVIIFLDKFIDCPYFLTQSGIYVTSEKKAVELSLFSGDINRYGMTKTLKKFTKTD